MHDRLHPSILTILALFLIFSQTFILGLFSTSSSAKDQALPINGTTERVSISSSGEQGNGFSWWSSISANGEYVAYSSLASNLVMGDTNEDYDIFVHNRQLGITERVSVSSSGEQGNGPSDYPIISADGRYVAFSSSATNLVEGDTGYYEDIFLRDLLLNETTIVSINSQGEQGNSNSLFPSISSNGRFVTFVSNATNLVDGDTNHNYDNFVHDQQTGETTRVSVSSSGEQGDGDSWMSVISENGRYVGFESNSSNLVADDTNGNYDIFIHDRQTGETTRVSISSNGEQANGDSSHPVLSGDGRYVAFSSFASNLVDNDTNGTGDVFVHDRQTGQTTRISVSSSGEQGNGGSIASSISNDGQLIAFYSDSSNLVDSDTNNVYDAFIHDLLTGSTTRISVSSSGEQGNNDSFSYSGSISEDKNYLSFVSDASNLVDGDINGDRDVFIHDLGGLSSDIGFRTYPDGYQFPNKDLGGTNYPDYTISDMQRMFGNDAVCRMVGSVCHPKSYALTWNVKANRSMNGGHCDGMASTSLRFYKNIDLHPDFSSTFVLDKTDDVLITWQGETYNSTVRRNIAFFFVEQLIPPVKLFKNEVRQQKPSQILEQLAASMSNGAPDPRTLFIRNILPSGKVQGHAITPYAISDQGDGEYWVWVYDNNHPDDANRHVVININNESWSYDLGGTTWYGNENTQTFGIVPISEYAQRPECPWCENLLYLAEVWLTGEGHLLIADSQGRQLGYIGSSYISEIPGAYGGFIDAGVGIDNEPIYTLPLTETYTILLDGQTLTQTASTSISQFGPMYAASVDDIKVYQSTHDYIFITNNGAQVGYHSSQAQTPDLILDLDTIGSNYGFTIENADIAANQAITLTANVNTGDLILNGSRSSGGEYNLSIRMLNSTGESTFSHANIPILETDTHKITFGPWDGSGVITLQIDHGSNGNFDETIYLENQKFTFLPLVELNR